MAVVTAADAWVWVAGIGTDGYLAEPFNRPVLDRAVVGLLSAIAPGEP